MSRVFTKNLANYMSLGVSGLANILSGRSAFSMSAKVRILSTTTGANDNVVINVAIDGATPNGVVLCLDGTAGAPKVRVRARSVSTDANQSKSGATTIGTGVDAWIGGVVDIAGDSIEVFLNGVSDGSAAVAFANTTWTKGTPTTADMIGGFGGAPPLATTVQFDGQISEVAIWSSKLVAADYLALKNGASPLSVSLSTLVYYLPIAGTTSPEPPSVGAPFGTITGSLPLGTDGWLESRSAIARSGVTYCGWAKPVMTFRLAGSVLASGTVLYESFKIVNAIDSHSSTMTFTMKGTAPVVGNDIKVTYTTPNVFEFAGTILQIRTTMRPGVTTILYECTATGYLWMMDRGESSSSPYLLVTGQYNCGANTAVADILARYTVGSFRVGYIPESLGNVSMNFENVRVSEAIGRIAQAVRAYWEVSADRIVSIYNTYPESTLPTLTNSSELLDDLDYYQDLTQVRTYTYYIGAGTTATSAVEVGSTAIPVANISPFTSKRTTTSSGRIVSGRNNLRTALVDAFSVREGPGTITLNATTPVVYRIESGDAVNLLAEASAAAGSVTALAAALGEGTGIAVNVTRDSTQWYDEAQDRADSDVQLFSTTISEFGYTTVHREVRPGRLQPVSMTTPFVVSGTFLIQSVEITTRGAVVSTNPVFYRRVSTSPWRLSMMNLLRNVRQVWTGKEL